MARARKVVKPPGAVNAVYRNLNIRVRPDTQPNSTGLLFRDGQAHTLLLQDIREELREQTDVLQDLLKLLLDCPEATRAIALRRKRKIDLA